MSINIFNLVIDYHQNIYVQYISAMYIKFVSKIIGLQSVKEETPTLYSKE